MNFTENSNRIFKQAILDYHKMDHVDTPIQNPYPHQSIEYYLYLKNWIDTVQWHLEDIIRDPNINPEEALKIKRRIDKSNQDRTDLVELIDSYFLDKYKGTQVKADATINTESPAWAIDRLSHTHMLQTHTCHTQTHRCYTHKHTQLLHTHTPVIHTHTYRHTDTHTHTHNTPYTHTHTHTHTHTNTQRV